MKTILYYHILTINNWEEIVDEQLMLIEESGLYDNLTEIQVSCLGCQIETLLDLIEDYPKARIAYCSETITEYEFPTLNLLYQDSLKEDFIGLYIHTKGVSFPGNSGGKYWRDYMNYYNITKWRSCVHELENGYDLCGVKLVTFGDKQHYSGNFFWFRSDYIRKLNPVDTLNKNDRFNAEFWSGTLEGKFACLSDEFVDYNTKGEFIKPKNYVHTLSYNLVSETEKATKSLYELNSDFHHIIVDLGFPLEKGNFIPDNIKKAKNRNSARLKALARKYGSEYVKLRNVGVSQNWTAIYEYLKMNPNDILIGADPDERPQQKNWVSAMAAILRSKKGIGMVSLTMPGQTAIPQKTINVNSITGINPKNNLSWALIGFRGDFLNKMQGVPVPHWADRYGWIEGAVNQYFGWSGFNMAFLPDYTVIHTDYECGDEGTSRLLREWKNLIVFEIKKYGQISFDDFLGRKKKGEFDNIKLHYK